MLSHGSQTVYRQMLLRTLNPMDVPLLAYTPAGADAGKRGVLLLGLLKHWPPRNQGQLKSVVCGNCEYARVLFTVPLSCGGGHT